MASPRSTPADSEKDVAFVQHHEVRLDHDGKDTWGSSNDNEAQIIVKDIDEGFDPAHVKRVVRKVDWRLIPILSAMYSVSLIDRTNLSLARAANENHMNNELHIGPGQGDGYSIVALMFFITYIIFEIPLGLRKFGARWWLSTAVNLWGLVMVLMGVVKTWQQLAAMRALLGLFESALFPGATFLISCWYPRKSMATRNVVFYLVACVLGSLSSPLGYSFTLLHGKGGYSGWRWCFFLYGVITIIVGIVAIFTIVDFPDKATFLSAEDKAVIQTRIARDRADAKPDPLTLAKCLTYAKDFKIWLLAFFFMSSTCASYSLAYFLPVILQSMGFNNVASMLLGTPTHVYAIIPALASAHIADRWRHCRAWAIVFNALCIIVGTCMYSQLPGSMKAARYAGVFLAVGGSNTNVPLVMSWAQANIRSQSKRGFTAAVLVAFGGTGGILSTVTFMNKEAKRGYPTGVYFAMATNAAVIVLATALHCYLRWQNRVSERTGKILEHHEGFRYQG